MMLRLIQQRLDPRLREAPCARIQRLLLAPDDRLGVLVHVEIFFQLGPGEGVELLDAGNGDVVEFVLGTVFVELDVGLAGAEDHAVDFVGGGDGVVMFGVLDDPLEVGVAREVFDGGAGERVAEEGF